MPWPEQLIHFIDFEGSIASGVLEYGVVSLLGSQIVSTRTRRCAATGAVRAEDSALHGLRAEDVLGAAPLADDFELFARLRETGPLAAHFANAENSLIKRVWPYARASPDFVRVGAATTEWGPWIDTGRLFPQLYPSLGSAALEDLINRFGLQDALDLAGARYCPSGRQHYHAALYDALAGALLLGRLAAEPAFAGQSVTWLLRLSTLDPDKRQALTQTELF